MFPGSLGLLSLRRSHVCNSDGPTTKHVRQILDPSLDYTTHGYDKSDR